MSDDRDKSDENEGKLVDGNDGDAVVVFKIAVGDDDDS